MVIFGSSAHRSFGLVSLDRNYFLVELLNYNELLKGRMRSKNAGLARGGEIPVGCIFCGHLSLKVRDSAVLPKYSL